MNKVAEKQSKHGTGGQTMTNEFILEDRLQKIRQVIGKYGEENFYVSFSGGKDSTVLSALIDMALPENKIPRVFSNTGIEYKLILDFVEREREREHSWDLVILTPKIPIKPMLEQEGYPFKSKEHSAMVGSFQGGNRDGKWIEAYLSKTGRYGCRKELRYQFTDDCKLKISDKCCKRLKEDPLKNYMKTAGKKYAIIGIMASEGGRRSGAKCLIFSNNKKNNKLIYFQPMTPLTKSWEDWFIQQYNIDICEIYKEPYNFPRTGCKGCPFNPRLSKDLDTLEKFFPAERKQCEAIWKPVYDEYRRLGYRLRKKGRKLMKTIQGRFREMYGFDDSHRCRECENLVRINVGKRNVYKCRKIGLTGSAATDIRLKDPACRLFEKRNEAEVHK